MKATIERATDEINRLEPSIDFGFAWYANAKYKLDSNTEASRYIEHLDEGSRVAVGDFVLARGFLGEVMDQVTSPFGYRSLRVELLAERPLPSLVSDWFRARDVVLLFAREKLTAGVARLLGDKAGLADNADLRSSVLAAWEVGLRDHIRNGRRRRRRNGPAQPPPPRGPSDAPEK